MNQVAALFVEYGGNYFVDGVEAWAKPTKDARDYSGELPVIAHPPCNRWSIGGSQDGMDEGCFESALANVRRCGGVLEQPAKSKAFKVYGLGTPMVGVGWMPSDDGRGYITHVCQFYYGHKAVKPTWLYYVGNQPPFGLIRGMPRNGEAITDCQHMSGSEERSRTPIGFRDTLIRLALHSR